MIEAPPRHKAHNKKRSIPATILCDNLKVYFIPRSFIYENEYRFQMKTIIDFTKSISRGNNENENAFQLISVLNTKYEQV